MLQEKRGLIFQLFLCVFCVLLSSPRSLLAAPKNIQLPPGFRISVFSDKVPGARSLAFGSQGTLFIGTRGNPGKVYALRDENSDFVADKVHVIADNLFMPNGVAFRDGALYVAEVNRILRFDEIEKQLENPPEPKVIRDDYPSEKAHGWKYIAFGPDGWLYVPVGAPCNICESSDPRFASITRIAPSGSQFEVVARGVRNSVGFDWHPETKELWFTDNGRDWLGDDAPADEFNRLTEVGQHFGYPYCHAGTISDPKFGHKRNCSDFRAPVQNLGPHVAALGVHFYRGKMFPKQYYHQPFIAEHGSWNRSTPIGYQVSVVFLSKNKPVLYQSFATGFRQEGEVVGRPVAFAEMNDGSLLVSDDHGGKVYRISYEAGFMNTASSTVTQLESIGSPFQDFADHASPDDSELLPPWLSVVSFRQ